MFICAWVRLVRVISVLVRLVLVSRSVFFCWWRVRLVGLLLLLVSGGSGFRLISSDGLLRSLIFLFGLGLLSMFGMNDSEECIVMLVVMVEIMLNRLSCLVLFSVLGCAYALLLVLMLMVVC